MSQYLPLMGVMQWRKREASQATIECQELHSAARGIGYLLLDEPLFAATSEVQIFLNELLASLGYVLTGSVLRLDFTGVTTLSSADLILAMGQSANLYCEQQLPSQVKWVGAKTLSHYLALPLDKKELWGKLRFFT